MRVLRDQRVAMRDGVHLATDVYLPDGDGPFPAILERTPYGKTEVSRSELTVADPRPWGRAEIAAYFARHGYAVVYQDCRGRHGSEGAFVKYLSDGEDGADTMAWLVRQTWCNGRIGTMGLSYAAHTQAALGCLAPPGLATQVLDSGGFSNAYQGGIRQGGAFELKQATWAFKQARDVSPAIAAALDQVDIKAWFARMPWRPGDSPLAAAPEYEAYLFDQWTHGNFDDFWKQIGLYMAGSYDRYPNVPMLHISSWYDPYPRTACENYLGLKSRGKGPQFLILGPWTHGDRSLTFAGDVEFGAAATLDGQIAPDWRAFRLRWFDRWLKGVDNGADRDPPARIFVMGGGSGRKIAAGRLDHGGAWAEFADWPPPAARFTPYYLHQDGGLRPARPDAGTRDYVSDPVHPVPSIGGAITSGAPVMQGGGFDQVEGPRFFGCAPPYRKLCDRPDVLSFQTAPLAAPVRVIGPIVARLFVSSDAPDTDFTIKLIDEYPPSADYPDGFALNLTDGILRARYRDSWAHPSMMEAGRVYEITVEAFPTANLFAAGHRIRLDIASSNFPKFDVNPQTGEAEGGATAMRKARNTVHMGRARASHVILPIVG